MKCLMGVMLALLAIGLAHAAPQSFRDAANTPATARTFDAGQPPYPQGYYPSRAAAEAACEGDKAWNKAYLENIDSPYYQVTDQICVQQPSSENDTEAALYIHAYIHEGPYPDGTQGDITYDNLTIYYPKIYNCSDPNRLSYAPCVPYNAYKALGCGCNQSSNGLDAGNPINIATGNKFERQVDYSQYSLSFIRYYNSDPSVRSAYMGIAWLNTYDRAIAYVEGTAPTSVTVQRPDGQELTYTKSNGEWIGDPDVSDVLIENDNSDGSISSWQLYVTATHLYENYSATGKLLSISDGSHIVDTITYTDGSQLSSDGMALQPGLLWKVTDANGRELIFGYDGQYRITSVTLPNGAKIAYNYNSSNYLSSVTYPGQAKRQYLYDESAYSAAGSDQGKLTGIIDEDNNRFATFGYQADGRAISTQHAGGADLTSISYSTDGTSATVTYPLGQQSTATLIQDFGSPHISAMSALCGVGCEQRFSAEALDSNGYPKSTTDFNGVTTAYTYDAAGLETQRIEAQGTPAQRTINTTWDTVFGNPLQRTIQNASGTLTAQTEWLYNARGQVLARCEEDPTVSGATGYVCSNSGTPPAGVRRWAYTYCDAVGGNCPLVGLLLSVTGPRTDLTQTTTYSYYATSSATSCGTPGAACYQAGDLHTVTDALGHTTTYVSYDASGRPTRIKDANGVNTDMTYTPRGWLHTRSVGGATTTIAYDAVGDVTKVTQPDKVFTSYGYDTAHRLTTITDALGNDVQFTLDAAGDRKAENTYASGSSSASRSLSRQYNTLGQLVEDQDAYGNITGYKYDADGNRTDSTDPYSVTTHSSYDALNRLAQTIQNYQGTGSTANTTTTYGYNSNDDLTQVSDPNGLNTNYTYDGLKDLGGLQSPDTGTTSSTFNAAGDRITAMDARGVVSTYSYDALDRLIGISYPTPGLSVGYYYDQSNGTTGCRTSYPIGRLTRMVDASGSTAWCYDARGNVIEKIQVTGTAKYTTFYTYNAASRLTGVTYPDGAKVTYTRDADGRIATVSATPVGGAATTVVSAITYQPFGPATGYSFADGGQTLDKLYDANYRATDIEGSALNLHFKLDKVGNITAEGNAPGVPTPNESYLYDPLYRLQQVDGSTGAAWQTYTYDATGDRLSKATAGLGTDTYSYTPNTHHLIGISGYDTSNRAMDANGNTTAFQADGWTYGLGYNDTNRLALVQQNGSTIATYGLNGVGERVAKTLTGGGTQAYVYDEAGHLLGEYATGQTRDYVWADGNVVGILDNPVQGGDSIHYVYTDALGTPRAVTTQGGTLVWDWPYNQNPFGEAPASSSSYTLNLRYPGQYFDQEDGLNYNGHRDYEPATGRFPESDPIGLKGGISTYAYVNNNPYLHTDSHGLSVTCDENSCTISAGDSILELAADLITISAISAERVIENEMHKNQCPTNDDDFCFNRWEAERAKCVIWGSLGARWVRACRDRARYRFQMCIQNGGTPDPDEPPPWIPSEDYPH